MPFLLLLLSFLFYHFVEFVQLFSAPWMRESASRLLFFWLAIPQMDTRETSALIPFLFIYTHKVDHCAEGVVNSKTLAVKEDLPQGILITSNDGDQSSANRREPRLRQWHGTSFPLIIDHNFPTRNKHDRPEFDHLWLPLSFLCISALLLSLLSLFPFSFPTTDLFPTGKGECIVV